MPDYRVALHWRIGVIGAMKKAISSLICVYWSKYPENQIMGDNKSSERISS